MVNQRNKWQEQWVEQNKRNDQINLQIKALANQFQFYIATQRLEREVGHNSKGILNTPPMGKEVNAHNIQEKVFKQW